MSKQKKTREELIDDALELQEKNKNSNETKTKYEIMRECFAKMRQETPIKRSKKTKLYLVPDIE